MNVSNTAAVRALRWAIGLLIVLGAASCVTKGADEPADPYLRPSARTEVEGFGQIAFRIDRMQGAVRCALLAETEEQHSQGLMDRLDMAGYDGMLFVFEDDQVGAFYMFQTPMPLSIAWFDSMGRYVSQADMEPCLDRRSFECPVYLANGEYRYALEVPKGGLSALGIAPGSVLTSGGNCP